MNKLLKQYEHAAIFNEAEQRDAALMALQNDYGISAIRVVQPFYYAFTHNGLHTEILPDGTVLRSYRQWDIERVRRTPVFFNYFPQWRRDWQRPERLPTGVPSDKPLFMTPEAEINYHLYNAFDRRFLTEPLRNDACQRIAKALADNISPRFAHFPRYETRKTADTDICLPHGITVWKRGLISHPRGRVMLNMATPTMLYGFDNFADGAIWCLQNQRRRILTAALPRLLDFLPTLPPSSEWWIVTLRAIAAYALALDSHRPRPVQLTFNF